MNVYEELLKHFDESLRKNQRVVNAVSQGPIGRPDSQLLLGEEGEKAWHVTTTLKAPKQKFVIFSDPFEFRKPSTYEPELWDELLRHHGVYRWLGSRIPLDELNPHTDVESFRNDASKMPYERKEQIIESLRQQGHNPDHYLIIDTHDYYEFLADFTLMMAERRGYFKDGFTPLSLEDSIVVYIKDNFIFSGLKNIPGVYSHLTALLPAHIREVLESLPLASHKYFPNDSFNLMSDDNLSSVFAKNIVYENRFLWLESHMAGNAGRFILPRMIIERVCLNNNSHTWDLSAIEGCVRVELYQNDINQKELNVTLPLQVSEVHLHRVYITPALRSAMPDSIEELHIELNQEQKLEEVVDIIKNLPNLKKLSIKLEQPVNNADLSVVQITTLKIESSSEIRLKAIPSSLESLSCHCKSLRIPNLSEHQSLKSVKIQGITEFIEYLPNSIEFIEVRNHSDRVQPREISFKKFIKLKFLALIDCRTIKSLKGLSNTLEGLCVIKCNSMDRLSLKGLNNLKILDLAHLGKDLRIYSDDSLSSVRYFSAIEIHSAQSFTDEEIRKAGISQLFQNKEFKKVEDIARTLTSCYQIVMSTVNSNSISLPSKPLDAITLKSKLITDMSGQVIEAILIDESMLMDESYYPPCVETLVVRKSLAWKFDLDCRKFYQLEELILEDVKGLVVVKNLPRSLKRLTFINCKDLLAIDFEGIKQLDTLILKNLNYELTIVNIENIKSVGHLEIENSCDRTYELLNLISGLEECRELIIRNEKRISMIQLPKRCASISFEHCSKVMALDFESVALLQNLKIEYCHELAAVRNLPLSLESLIIQFNYSFDSRSLQNLADLPLLTEATLYLNGPEVRSDLDFNADLSDLTNKKLDKLIENKKLEVESNDANNLMGVIPDVNSSDGSRDLLSATVLKLNGLFLRGQYFVPNFSQFTALKSLSLTGMCLKDVDRIPKQIKALRLKEFYLPSKDIDLSSLPRLKKIKLVKNQSNVSIIAKPSNDLEVAISNLEGTVKINCGKCQKFDVKVNQDFVLFMDLSLSETEISVHSEDSVTTISGLPSVVKNLLFSKTLSGNDRYRVDFSGVSKVEELSIGPNLLKNVVFLNVSKDLTVDGLGIVDSPEYKHAPLTDEFKEFISTVQIRSIKISDLSYVSGLKFNPKTELIEISKCSDMDEMNFEGCNNLQSLMIKKSDLREVRALPQSLTQLILRENSDLTEPSLKGLSNLFKINLFSNKSVAVQLMKTDSAAKDPRASFLDPNDIHRTSLSIHSRIWDGDWEMPDIARYSKLQKLEINRMILFRELDHLPVKITSLVLNSCYFRGGSLDLSRFKNLETIDLSNLINVHTIIGFPSKLKKLVIKNCSELSFLDLKNISEVMDLSIGYADDQITDVRFNADLSVDSLWVNPMACKSLAGLIRSLNIYKVHLNAMIDEPLLLSGVEDKITSINIASNREVSGEISFNAFALLRRLTISHSNRITAITDLPRSIRSIELMGNTNLKMPDLDELLDTLEHVKIVSCDLINAEYARYLSQRYPVPEYNGRSSLLSSSASSSAADEPMQITLDSLRNDRDKIQNREKVEKRRESFQAYVDEVLKENEEYEEAHSFGSMQGGSGVSDRHEYNTMKIKGSTVYSPDSKTGFVTHFHDNSQYGAGNEQDNFLMVYDKRGLLINNYFRSCAYNTVVCDVKRRELYFCYQPKEARRIPLVQYKNCNRFENDTLHDLKRYVNQHPKWAMAFADFEIKPAQEITLVTTPILYPPDQLVLFCNEAKDLDLIFDPVERKVSVALKSGMSTKHIQIAYRFDIQEHYLLENFNDDLKLCLSPKPLLKDDLMSELRDVIEGVDELRVLNRPDVELREKLACLFEFCKNFNQEETPDNESGNTLDILFSQIKNSRGVCRHRSEVFMLLCHYLNIPFTMFANGKHMFGELLFYTKSGFVRYGVCSGGGVVLDLVKKSDALEPVNPFIKLISEREQNQDCHNNAGNVAASEAPKDKEELNDNTLSSAVLAEAAEARAREEEAKLKAEAAERERQEAERKAQEEAEARAREEEAKLTAETAERERQEAERKAQEEVEARAREEEARLKAEAAQRERQEAESKAQEEAEARAREEEERLQAVTVEKEHEEVERKAREESDAKAREKAERKLKEVAEAEVRRIAEEKAREAADPFPAVKIITSIVSLLSRDAPHAPLLRLPNNLDPIKVFAGIRSEILSCQNLDWPANILYVHNPSDLRRYVKSIKIADGNRGFVEGPLRELLKTGGMVVINWTDFTKHQKKSYMSMLEPGGNLMGHSVCASLKIISLIQDKFRTGPRAFFSRTTPFLLTQSYKPQIISPEQNSASQDTIVVDLYEMPNWRERLFGEIFVDADGYHVSENGALRRAVNEKKNLRLVNCPDTPNFNTFLNRLRSERRIFVNAQFFELPDSCVIQTVKKEHALKNDNITVKSRPDDQSPLGIFCNANNLYECFHREVVDTEKRMRTATLPWFATEENQFYITERITREEWTELLDRHQDFPQRPLTFTLLPGGEIEGVAIYTGEQNAITETSRLVFSNDPDLYVNQLKAELLPKAIIVDVNPQMSYQELMAKLDDRRDEQGKVEFEYEPFVVMNDLIRGKTIILNGAMSLLLYQQLLPFLYPDLARFNQNGKSAELKGQLICVMPLEYQDQYLYQQIQVQQYHFTDYTELLPFEDRDLANKIKFLFDCAGRLNHRGLGQPPVPALTYRRLTSMITRLNDESLQSVHPENPIKGLFHYDYPKSSDNFAFLSVIAKILFAPKRSDKQVHSLKWSRLRKAKKIESKEDLANHIWKALNCCYGQTLRELLGDSLEKSVQYKTGKPHLNDSVLIEKVFNLLQSPIAKENVESLANEHKPTQQLQTLFYNPNTRAIFLKSTPGTGKSYQTRQLRAQLPDGHYFKGLIQLEACLSAIPVNDKPIVNNPDEVNMEEPGTLDVFKGFLRGTGPGHYRGKYYKSTPQFKVVGSGNPETYANRFFHAFIQEYAETVLFEMPHEEWLRKNIIDTELLELNLMQDAANHVAEKLLWSFYHVKNYEPHCEISLRDLRSLVQRFIVAYKANGNILESVKRAQWHEFGLMIRDLQQREAYQKAVEWKNQNEQLQIKEVGNLFIPSTKLPLVEIIEEDLAVCALAAKKKCTYRRGILLEGPSGIGKSSLYKALLEQQGFGKDHADPQKRYYEISLDEGDEAARLVIRALCDGSKIILDEIDTRIEKLLIALMEGELPEDPDLVALIHEVVGEQFEVNPSGFVMASQNPGEVISLALMNRFHYIQACDYTNEEWMAILKEARIQKPEYVLEKFNEACKRDPTNYNPRKMFEWMRKEIDKAPQESKVSDSQQTQVSGITPDLLH
ncbi:MAG: hypothetical protein K2X50_07075 [Gammaproteobacteria bacterium]|nr:hypothetical protein [Gammaproteobacteria bacterium]